MARRPLVAVGLVVLLVAAGCQAPVNPQAAAEPTTTGAPTTAAPATDAPGTTTADAGDGFVRTDADLGVDAERIYERVGRLLEVPRDRWPEVQVRVEEPPEGGGPGVSQPTSFAQVLGITPESGGEGGSGGVTTAAVARGTVVTLYNADAMNETRRRNVLAHEFVHVFQRLSDVQTPLLELGANRNTLLLYRTVLEGAAEYVQEEYAIEYQDARVNQTALSPAWKNASAYVRWSLAPYQYGSRYYERRVDGPANVSAVYETPPRTTEQVIHGFAPDEEPVADLDVSTNASGTLGLLGATTKGELFARIALSTELGWERAADAAAGWDADRLLVLSVDGERGYAWALRYENASEAGEFAAAFEDYAADRSRPFESERVGDDTVVVFAGAESFVANASATGSAGDVTVHV